MPVYLASLEDKPFVRQVWLCRLGDGYRSDLDCYDGSLNVIDGVHGVRKVITEDDKGLERKILGRQTFW